MWVPLHKVVEDQGVVNSVDQRWYITYQWIEYRGVSDLMIKAPENDSCVISKFDHDSFPE